MTHRVATPPTVLVVDDSRDFVNVISRFLLRRGMRVLTAYSGRECLEQVCRHAIDVIILDVMMPGMSGLEVCTALRQTPAGRSIPVILLTARDDLKTRLAGVELGISEYMVKPVQSHELLARVQTQVEVSRHMRMLDDALSSVGSLYGTA
ncbi:MAG: response regulator [Candidatus Binatia bacterium]|nr:response regulator [Candidatus Binatia bacterium]